MMSRCAVLILGVLLPSAPVWAEANDFFEQRIRPVLHDHCVECHGPEKQKGGLRLDSREAILQGGESGPAMVLGQPDASLLLKAVRQVDPDLKMPPARVGPRLSDAVLADLADWVQKGAPWAPGVSPAPSPAKEVFQLEARKQRLPWIWQSPQRQAVPPVAGPTPANEVDSFILARLQAVGLSLSPPAEGRIWLRRAHFALTGLPPQRADLEAGVADPSPQGRERAVDALLASPHFGERWARHWMDLVRYAESRGHESDFLIANAWRYRDYLIRAYNADVPYDRFVAEHIAGDLLPPRLDPANGANESVLATGWAFLGEENHSPVDIRQDECERVDNKVDVLSKTFLGLTVGCARCHDHKFDAITQQDYYALSGFVLGSPYRQVRFQTREAEARVAGQLEELRGQEVGKITAAFADSARPGVASLAAYLLAAQDGELGETADRAGLDASRLSAWQEQLQQAAAGPSHPLRAFAQLAAAPLGGFAARLAELRAAVPAAAAAVRVVADFTEAGRTPWKTDGPTFGTRPLAAGELVLGTPERPLARFLTCGAASREPFWNRLGISPGNESDAGSLAAEARAGRTLLVPKFTLESGRLHYLVRGRVRVYAGVDSHIMLAGPLHGNLMANFDSGAAAAWVSHDLSAYAGHRLHLEFSALGDSPLEVMQVVEAPEAPTWGLAAPWPLPQEAPNLAAVAAELQSDCAAALEALAAGRVGLSAAQAVLVDWLGQHPALTGYAPTAVAAAAADYFRRREELAATVRWDSATAVSWADGSGVDEAVLLRGKPGRPGALAPRGLPVAFGGPRITTVQSSGRAELAAQMTDPANPLVARVFVNRVWHHLFGRGIVPTVDNFGYLGERPSHPELLDHLAWQFMHEDGWSLKRLLRRLVLTEVFAQSSSRGEARSEALDPANGLLHRMPVRRLEGEAIRDALLAVSGRLDPALGGPPIPVQLTEFIVGRGRPEASGPLDGAGRRSLYLGARRNFLPTMMLAFDLPTPFSTVGRRNVTNVPAQSLVMMNDPLVAEQAARWAERLLKERPGASVAERIRWLCETAWARPPTAEEAEVAIQSLAEMAALRPGEPEVISWAELGHALLNANDFIYLK